MSKIQQSGTVSTDNLYQKITPNSYTDLEYLQSTGTQYINTGVNETDDTAIDLHILNETVSSNYLYGARQNSGAMIYNGLYRNNSLEYNGLTISYPASSDVVMTQDVQGNNMAITINGILYLRSMGTSNKEPIYIFACNNSSIRYYPGGYKLYYFRIKQHGGTVRNFIPAKRNSDSVLGLYDTVTNTFYTNSGTGNFMAGPELESQTVKIGVSMIKSANFIEE